MSIQEEYLNEAKKMRQEWAASDARRDAGLTEPDNIEKVRDIVYAASNTIEEEHWHLMDIYYPKGQNEELFPVIVSVHGGGWFYGDKELYRFYTMYLASKGFAVVNFNYRRSPEYKYPAGFLDVCDLMDFIAVHKEKFKLDMERLYMVGDSAGAQLVSQYCIYATNPEYRELFDLPENGIIPVPKKVALNCGIYDLGDVFYRNMSTCNWYLPELLEGNLAKSFFKVLDYMTPDFPATYLMTSINDALSEYTVPMKRKLKKLKVPFIYREFGCDTPEDGHVFHLNMYSLAGMQCNEEELEFFTGTRRISMMSMT